MLGRSREARPAHLGLESGGELTGGRGSTLGRSFGRRFHGDRWWRGRFRPASGWNRSGKQRRRRGIGGGGGGGAAGNGVLAYLSMHCEFLLREFCKPRWISTLNQKYLFVITSLTTTQFEYGLSFRWNQKNQGHHIKKSFGRQGSPEIQEVLRRRR